MQDCDILPTGVLAPTNIASTHWGQDKMAIILQMTFLNAFSWIKMS